MNEAIIAAAGGGKTTRIVRRALGARPERSALLTYTQNNVSEITKKFYKINAAIPPHVEVWSWYTFLLRELARPYQKELIDGRIDGIFWAKGRSDIYAKKTDIDRFYFGGGKLIYSDKLAKFICECNKASKGAVMSRLEQRYDQIYIDEIQDMAGYDIDLIELILRSRVKLTIVGDHRQSTFRTNNAPKNSGYAGVNIVKKFQEWRKVNLCRLTYEQETYRCNQAIADLADAFFPDDPRTISLNLEKTGHDGIFCVSLADIDAYMTRYRPQVLRLDVKTDCRGCEAMNFGESKGLTFDRVLIFPHKLGKKWLESGDFKHVTNSAAKMYVGITRARYSVAFAFDGESKIVGVNRFVSTH
jgi:DNA helicase-2/ATP-dependent DNA helicase PcrA